MKKVDEPNTNSEVWQCPRCKQDYCGECVDSVEVDFNIFDKPDGYNQRDENWKGLQVCPWCYNQLIDVFERPPK